MLHVSLSFPSSLFSLLSQDISVNGGQWTVYPDSLSLHSTDGFGGVGEREESNILHDLQCSVSLKRTSLVYISSSSFSSSTGMSFGILSSLRILLFMEQSSLKLLVNGHFTVISPLFFFFVYKFYNFISLFSSFECHAKRIPSPAFTIYRITSIVIVRLSTIVIVRRSSIVIWYSLINRIPAENPWVLSGSVLFFTLIPFDGSKFQLTFTHHHQKLPFINHWHHQHHHHQSTMFGCVRWWQDLLLKSSDGIFHAHTLRTSIHRRHSHSIRTENGSLFVIEIRIMASRICKSIIWLWGDWGKRRSLSLSLDFSGTSTAIKDTHNQSKFGVNAKS